MGHGSYSYDAHHALLKDRSAGKSAEAVFTQRSCHPLMDPKGVRFRESRDSVDHPNALSVVFALDVTGSMGAIPKLLATTQLPGFMKLLYDCGVPDPQLLFMAVGDAVSDRAPLQVGQFESTGELMDQWLTRAWLESGGGGTLEESYELGLYFLARHTALDSVEKRKKKGYVFMTGDENPYPALARSIVKDVVGDELDDDLKVEAIVAEVSKTYEPFFIIPEEARRARCERSWRKLLGDHVLCTESPDDVCYAAAGALLINEGLVPDLATLVEVFGKAGLPKRQAEGVVHALEPFAATRGIGGVSVMAQLKGLLTGLVK